VQFSFSHRWNWIEPLGPEDVFLDWLGLFVNIPGNIDDAYDLVSMMSGTAQCLPEITYTYKLGSGTTQSVLQASRDSSCTVKVRIPLWKGLALYDSYLAAWAGNIHTYIAYALTGAAFISFGATAPEAAALFAAEAGEIVTSELTYLTAMDPAPDFRSVPEKKPFASKTFERLKGVIPEGTPERNFVSAMWDAISALEAAKEAMVRFEGARKAGEPEFQKRQLDAFISYATQAKSAFDRARAELLKVLEKVELPPRRMWEGVRPKIVQTLREKGLPEVEAEILKERGYKPEKIGKIAEATARLLEKKPELFDPSKMKEELPRHLERLSRGLDQAIGEAKKLRAGIK